MLTFVTYRAIARGGHCAHIAKPGDATHQGAAMNATTRMTTTASISAATPAVPTTPAANDASARAEHSRREAEYLALRELAAKAQRLDRQIQRERSYAALRYAG